jgi:hypothetical protein
MKCAWIVWDVEYPDEGITVVFTEGAERAAAVAAGCDALGYDEAYRAAWGVGGNALVHVVRAPALDRYTAPADVPDGALEAALIAMVRAGETLATGATL